MITTRVIIVVFFVGLAAGTDHHECTGHGDPHYTTFDGAHLSLTHDCKYVMAEVTGIPGCNVRVEVKNEKRPTSKFPMHAFTRLIDVKINGNTIRLGKGKTIFVNGNAQAIGYSKHNVTITNEDSFNVITTSCGVIVKFDGYNVVSIDVPIAMSSKMTGLCGNCNGEAIDDLVVDGRSVDSYADKNVAMMNLAKTFIVHDDSDKPSTNAECIV